MICYKDKTFCTFYKECKFGDECDRALTPEVEHDAELWWNDSEGISESSTPICIYSDEPKCFEKIK